jgi:hypothetical protein
MMNQRLFLGTVSALVLSVCLCGCGKPSGSGTETSSAVEKPHGAAGDVGSNVEGSGESLALAGGTGQTAGITFDKTKDAAAAGPSIAVGLQGEGTGGSTGTEVKALLPDGSLYIGEMRDGKVNGRGSVISPDGTNQQGEWRDGQPYRVSGTWVAADGTREVGTWNADGTRSGGKIAWKDGRKYEGDWKVVPNGSESPDGTGTMTWPDGRQFVGQFYNGQPDGTGKMTYLDGKVENGLWKQGNFVGAAQ